ncbi:hypothetical protein NQ317_005748 [Molorchus minor]|uniref:Uncharacterized protein n=1 Tax=Molorchus minor TaxID=1323400 RepID=A0ABQ9JMY7_9CUCU|nr:hypothetical protein NQ317_005748 [Molorchus minor]
MNNCESEKIVEAANIAISNLLPTKSRSLYDIAYNRFKKWCAEKNVQVYSENVLLAYFSENAKNGPFLPTQYSYFISLKYHLNIAFLTCTIEICNKKYGGKAHYKSFTLWAQYSMVTSCLIIYVNIDISKFPKPIAFLKRTGDGYQAKK